MAVDLKPVQEYMQAIDKELAAGKTTEHSHRPAIKTLLETVNPHVTATNEPQHITAVGAPDFRIVKNHLTTGYVECKDIGVDLDETLKTDQLQRYLKLPNLVLTNYLEFRWYVEGSERMRVWLGHIEKSKVKPDDAGQGKTAELLGSFLLHSPQPIDNPKELAQHMARLAHIMGFIIKNALEGQIYAGSLHNQLMAFRQNLIPDLSNAQFADMYAQTIAYGLFAARCQTDKGKDFSRDKASYLIPKTNPFLRKLFNHIAGPDLDERLVGAVDDLAQILAQADMTAILKGFGKTTGKDDPVVHFYETFLKEYDPKTREMRGVYYTPLPVVSYIVRSIDHLLKTRFNKPQGFADPSVLVLDPAVGTATFLYVVMQEIHSTIVKQGQTGIWNDYVEQKLLPRLFGFELLMAPYAIAHLKLGLLLQETGYEFRGDQRLGIYLTNTLEESVKHSETMFAQWITEEANAAAEIKKDKPVMVVLGNPPYSKASANKGEYIEKLMEVYKTAVRKERNIQPLSDDYVKFIRFAHERIERTGYGVVGMITNHSYLSGLIHRGMREQLVKAFDEIYVLNLHGSALLGDGTPDGGKDENVFDIRQGVAIILLVRRIDHAHGTGVQYADLWGLRESKYNVLAESDIEATAFRMLKPTGPFYFFVPRGSEFREEYASYASLTDVFPVYSSGIKTHRDHFVIDFDKSCLKERIASFREMVNSDEHIKEHLRLNNTGSWNLANARVAIRDDNDWETAFTKCLYRPFDIRHIFYHKAVVDRPRFEVMRHMLTGKNMALIVDRTTSVDIHFNHVFAASYPIDVRTLPDYGGAPFIFPVYLYPEAGEMQFEGGTRRPNLKQDFVKSLSEELGLKLVEDGKGNLNDTFGPEDVFNYAYAVFHSPTYRNRYAEFLKIDFPRLPLTTDKKLFKTLAEKGSELVSLHLMESQALNTPIASYPQEGSNDVEKVSYNEKEHRVYINKTQYFEGVPKEVWNFHVGGYQVCERWLKERKGRKLSYDDVVHYQEIVTALKETIRLMNEIDTLIPEWPIK